MQTLLQLAVMNELPTPRQLRDTVLFLELSDEHLGDGNVLKLVRAFGETGYFNAVAAVLFGLPPHSRSQGAEQAAAPDPGAATKLLSAVSSEIGNYNDELPRVLGVPIGHLRPQYVIPYGGTIEVDGINRTVTVFYESN